MPDAHRRSEMFELDQETTGAANAVLPTTPRKARNADVRDEGLRMIGERKWLDPETAKACKEMRAEMMQAREPTAQEMGLFFYLREPMLKDPTYLVACWERGREKPILFQRHDTIGAALHAMQQKWRDKRLEEMTGGSSEGFYAEW
ncbi:MULTISPECIES: hypothetical protein [Thiomonas]|nr:MULTISPECIES: hypothetical protein [Thiomonas]